MAIPAPYLVTVEAFNPQATRNARLWPAAKHKRSGPVPRSRVIVYERDLTRGRLFMADVTIEVRPNGPYVVTGTIELRDTNGNLLPAQPRTVLCRCGASTKKPLCDGTHSKVGFQAAAQAVPDSVEKS